MSGKYDCSVKGVVYKITCSICGDFYVGETSRPIHDRFLEHRQAATTPHKHLCNGIACHYLEKHKGVLPSLKLEILASGTTNTIKRKIIEASYIKRLKPELNNKDECELVQSFLLWLWRIVYWYNCSSVLRNSDRERGRERRCVSKWEVSSIGLIDV